MSSSILENLSAENKGYGYGSSHLPTQESLYIRNDWDGIKLVRVELLKATSANAFLKRRV